MDTLIGTIPKSDIAEVRVKTLTFKNRRVLDIRVWFIPRDAVDFVASRKGVTVDLSKVPDLIKLLERIGK